MAAKRMGCTSVLLFLMVINSVNSFNIDVKLPWIYNEPLDNSYFGYSVAFHDRSHILVGAPLAKEATTDKEADGVVYKCLTDDIKSDRVCSKVAALPDIGTNAVKANQWRGATVYSNNEEILICSPRHKTNQGGDILLTGKCEYINEKLPRQSFLWTPCPKKQANKKLEAFQWCQTGYSAKLAGNVDKAIYSGLPNAEINKGILMRKSGDGQSDGIFDNALLNSSDYLGYSMTTGKFLKDGNTIVAVGGAPRGNDLSGMVVLYNTNAEGYPVLSTINFPEEQTGSYFGSALAAADIDNDGFSDLVVGAPYYGNDKKNVPNTGAFYVYINDKNGGLRLNQTEYGTKTNGFFGYSIGSVGDLNGDSLPDIAIGEPWGGDDGKGVVYLYYGSKNKITPLLLRQTIKPTDIVGGSVLEGFGFSFAEYFPYNENRPKLNNADYKAYNDLLVGSYKSGHAVLLRSRPIYTIVGSILTTVKEIDLYDHDQATMCTNSKGVKVKCIKDVKICFVAANFDQDITVDYTVTMDAHSTVSLRGYLDLNQKNQTVYKGKYQIKKADGSTSTDQCADALSLNIHLVNNTKDLIRPFVIKVEWDLDQTACRAGVLCPLANKMISLYTILSIPYTKGCSSAGCKSDLSIKLDTYVQDSLSSESAAITYSKGTDVPISGDQTIARLVATIENDGENAYTNRLEIEYPDGVIPEKVRIDNMQRTPTWDPSVKLDSGLNVMGITLNSPLGPKAKEIVTINFKVKNIDAGWSMVFKAEVLTESKDTDTTNNIKTVTMNTVFMSELSVEGNVQPDQYKWNADNTSPNMVGTTITHEFFFQNSGPSDVKTSDVEIQFPEKVNGDYILNLMAIQLEARTRTNEANPPTGTCDQENLNPLDLNVAGITTTNTTRKRRNVAKSIDCGDATTCRAIKCKLNNMLKSDRVRITLTSTLVESTFENKIKENRRVIVEAKFTSDAVQVDKNSKNVYKVTLDVNSPHLTIEERGEPIKWWIILLCILGAIIIIGLIVFILFKKGFFKRKRPGEDQEELEEEEKLRSGDPDDY